MTFDPLTRGMLALQEVVPVAVPLPPRELVQLTCVTPTLSDAVPAMAREEVVVENGLAAGVVIETAGAVVSGEV
jgi:hypothetical protein